MKKIKLILKNPFKISFKKELPDLDKDKIIELFLINLKGTLYKEIEKENNDRIIIKGEFHSFDPTKNVPWNLWTGFSSKAELYFPKDNIVVYSIDFKYGIISIVLGLLLMILTPLLFSGSLDSFYFVFLAVVLSLMLISIAVKLLHHRQLFQKTIRLENKYLGNYDWKEILKNKTDSELVRIANGNTTLPIEVQNMAKEEVERRSNNNER